MGIHHNAEPFDFSLMYEPGMAAEPESGRQHTWKEAPMHMVGNGRLPDPLIRQVGDCDIASRGCKKTGGSRGIRTPDSRIKSPVL